jgi:hypothetical protein
LIGGSCVIGAVVWHVRRRPLGKATPATLSADTPAESVQEPPEQNQTGREAILRKRYQPKALLSDWERRALLAFRAQIPAGHYVCPQVRLAELVSIVVDPRRFPEALNRVAGKSLDFVVIELATGRPVLAIELDDRSHQQRQRQDRDRFVNDLMEALNIPLRRFTPSMTLDVSGHFAPGPSARQVLARPAR